MFDQEVYTKSCIMREQGPY